MLVFIQDRLLRLAGMARYNNITKRGLEAMNYIISLYTNLNGTGKINNKLDRHNVMLTPFLYQYCHCVYITADVL